MQTDIRKGDEMNAILHCYDDVAHLVNQDVIEKMGGIDTWKAKQSSFREMQNKGVSKKDLLELFIQSPKIPSKVKRKFAFKCAEHAIHFLSPRIKDRSVILKALASVSERSQEQRKKAINDLRQFGQTLKLNCRVTQDIQDSFALAAVAIATTDLENIPSGVYGCSLYTRYAALYYGGKEFIEKESQAQLDDIIEITETDIE